MLEASVPGRDKYLHPTENCGMQLLIPAWDTCFWHQSPQLTIDVRSRLYQVNNKVVLHNEVPAAKLEHLYIYIYEI